MGEEKKTVMVHKNEEGADVLGNMAVGALILRMSWPPILSMFVQAFYNFVDSFFVSKLGEEALAAVTYIFPVQMLLISVGVGTGVGLNSLIARRLGAGRDNEANLAASHGYRLAFLNWLLFAIIGFFFSSDFMTTMSNTEYIVDNGTVYMTILTAGSLFLMMHVVGEKIIQATGQLRIQILFCNIAGALINIILDPLLIFGMGSFPELGIAGAAVATIIAQFISMVFIQILLFKGGHPVKIKLLGFKTNKKIYKDIYSVAGPSILMQSIVSVMGFGMNIILAGLSETAVAVLGIYGRLQSVIFMPVFGLTIGVLPIMGYNYGARNRARLMETYKKALLFSFFIMLAGFIIFQIWPEELIGIFNEKRNEDMYDIGINALRIISICFMPAAFGIMTSTMFQGTGHGFYSLWGSLLRQIVGILPLAWLLANTGGVDAVWFAFPLAEIIGMTYFAFSFRHLYKTEIRRLDLYEDNTF